MLHEMDMLEIGQHVPNVNILEQEAVVMKKNGILWEFL